MSGKNPRLNPLNTRIQLLATVAPQLALAGIY
jgi:hypothetical protein